MFPPPRWGVFFHSELPGRATTHNRSGPFVFDCLNRLADPFGLPGDRYLGARSAAALPAAGRLLPSVCDRKLSPRATQPPSLGAHAYGFGLLTYWQAMVCGCFDFTRNCN